MGRLQKSRSNSVLNRASRHRRWQALAHLPYWRGSQGDGIGCVDGREIGWAYSNSGCCRACLRLPGNHDGGAGTAQLGHIAICSQADLESWALAANDRTIEIRL